MCAKAKANPVSIVSTDLITIEQLLSELWLRSFSATSESSTASGCSPLRMGLDSQERRAASHAFGSTSF